MRFCSYIFEWIFDSRKFLIGAFSNFTEFFNRDPGNFIEVFQKTVDSFNHFIDSTLYPDRYVVSEYLPKIGNLRECRLEYSHEYIHDFSRICHDSPEYKTNKTTESFNSGHYSLKCSDYEVEYGKNYLAESELILDSFSIIFGK